MNTQTVDYADLLLEAIKQAKESAPRAVDDIVRCASKAAVAVNKVTNGLAVLELVPIDESENPNIYQLQLRKVGSEAPPSDLGVYRVSKGGYPVQRWLSRTSWETHTNRFGATDEEFQNLEELDAHFRWLVSDPKSRLVILVTFFQQ